MQNEKPIPISSLASDEDKPNGKELPTKQSYGNEFNAHFLEQYKLYIEMADRVSSRRVQIASLYTSILSALLALLSITSNKELFQGSQSVVLLAMSVLGLCLCLAWNININSYKQLNRLKFKVIHKMESHLPFPCYSMEWELLSSDSDLQKYFRLTAIEKYIPLILSAPYWCLFIYSSIKIFDELIS
jgi:hypothetical protein